MDWRDGMIYSDSKIRGVAGANELGGGGVFAAHKNILSPRLITTDITLLAATNIKTFMSQDSFYPKAKRAVWTKFLYSGVRGMSTKSGGNGLPKTPGPMLFCLS